jgi:hypothetical protein
VERTFTDEELRLGGMRSVDALREALERGDREVAARFGRRLRREAISMLGNYDAWDRMLTESLAELGGANAADTFAATLPEYPDGQTRQPGAPEELRARAEEIAAAIAAGDDARAGELATKLHAFALRLHDRGMTRVLALLQQIGRKHGDDALGVALERAMASDMIGNASFRERAEGLMHFSRVHLQPFELVEDDEKLTFLCSVCPSGGRMIVEGHYGDDPFHMKGPRDLTWGLDELPAYCVHEPIMEKASIEATGEPLFIIEPSEQMGVVPCKTYLYKRRADIPERYYTRVGCQKPSDD